MYYSGDQVATSPMSTPPRGYFSGPGVRPGRLGHGQLDPGLEPARQPAYDMRWRAGTAAGSQGGVLASGSGSELHGQPPAYYGSHVGSPSLMQLSQAWVPASASSESGKAMMMAPVSMMSPSPTRMQQEQQEQQLLPQDQHSLVTNGHMGAHRAGYWPQPVTLHDTQPSGATAASTVVPVAVAATNGHPVAAPARSTSASQAPPPRYSIVVPRHLQLALSVSAGGTRQPPPSSDDMVVASPLPPHTVAAIPVPAHKAPPTAHSSATSSPLHSSLRQPSTASSTQAVAAQGSVPVPVQALVVGSMQAAAPQGHMFHELARLRLVVLEAQQKAEAAEADQHKLRTQRDDALAALRQSRQELTDLQVPTRMASCKPLYRP